MIKFSDIIDEIGVNIPNNFLSFVENKKIEIFKILEGIESDLEENTSIYDIANAFCEEEALFDEGVFDTISITQNRNQINDCSGILISLRSPEEWHERGSGTSFRLVPNITFQGKPIYYDTIWC